MVCKSGSQSQVVLDTTNLSLLPSPESFTFRMFSTESIFSATIWERQVMWCGGESEKYKTGKKRNKDFSFQTQVEPGWLFFPPQGNMHPVCAHLLRRSFSASLSYLLHRPSLLSASILSGCQLSYPRPHTDKASPLLNELCPRQSDSAFPSFSPHIPHFPSYL